MADRFDVSASLVTATFLGTSLAIQPRAFSTFIGAAIIFVVASTVFLITRLVFQGVAETILETARHTSDDIVRFRRCWLPSAVVRSVVDVRRLVKTLKR
jgi:hypothetical protein